MRWVHECGRWPKDLPYMHAWMSDLNEYDIVTHTAHPDEMVMSLSTS